MNLSLFKLEINLRLYAKETADVICHAIGFCYTEKGQDECHMFPPPKVTLNILLLNVE